MLFWILETISMAVAILIGTNMGATMLGIIGYTILFFVLFSLVSAVGIGIASELVPVQSTRIESKVRYGVKSIDTAYVYLDNGEEIPIELFSKFRPTKNASYVEELNFCEGGWKGFWLWHTNIYVPEFILYIGEE